MFSELKGVREIMHNFESDFLQYLIHISLWGMDTKMFKSANIIIIVY